MRQKRIRNTIITSSLFGTALIVAALLCAGCAAQHQFVKSGATYRAYEGPILPPDQVAVVDVVRTGTPPTIISVDGVALGKLGSHCPNESIFPSGRFLRAELMPGKHTLEVVVSGHKSGPAMALIQATLHAAHTYELRFEGYGYMAGDSSGFAVMLVDKATGEMVGGRKPGDAYMPWSVLDDRLKQMVRERKTQADVLELIGIPRDLYLKRVTVTCSDKISHTFQMNGNFTDPFPEHTLVYMACKSGPHRSSGSINYFSYKVDSHTEYVRSGYKDCGFLFIKFNQSDELQNYYYVEVPFNKCYSSSSLSHLWDREGMEGSHIKKMSCRYRQKLLAYVEYFARSGNPDEAYNALESGIINAHGKIGYMTKDRNILKNYPKILKENVDLDAAVLFSDGVALMKRFPDMFVSANNSFTAANFMKSVDKYGDTAAAVERDRIVVYRRLVGAGRAQQAEHEFSSFFGVTLDN